MSHSGSIPQLRETQVEGIINGQGNDSIFLLGCTSLFRGKQCKYCVRGPVRCARITVVHFFVVPFGYLGVCSMTHIWLPIYEPYMTHIYIFMINMMIYRSESVTKALSWKQGFPGASGARCPWCHLCPGEAKTLKDGRGLGGRGTSCRGLMGIGI